MMTKLRYLPATAALVIAACLGLGLPAHAAEAEAAAPPPLPSLDVQGYLGTWHQIALYPNRFQAQCVAQTRATYALRPDGALSVVNRCRTASGAVEEVQGLARPRGGARIVGGQLEPASLQVSFLPAWLRWLPVGWGDYDVVQRLHGGSIAVVSEPSREYLWVLSREPAVPREVWQSVQAWLQGAGFDLARLQVEPQAVQP